MTPDEIKSLIRRKAAEAGIDPTHALTMASIETGGTFDPRAGAGKKYQGLFQFGPTEWKTYGGGDIFDPNAQLDAYVKYMPVIQQTMRTALGREPTPQELYLGWQQGAGGASSLLKGADKPVGQLTTIGNVTANGGTPNMTGAQFAGLWNDKYNAHQRAVLGQQPQWTGEGDTQTTPAADPRTAGDADLGGYGGSPRIPTATASAKPFDFGGLLGAGMRQVAAGSPQAPEQPAWIQQAMNAPAQAHRPQMQAAGLLASIFPDEQRRRMLMGGLLGDE